MTTVGFENDGRRRTVVALITALTARDGYAPTVRELMTAMGLKSPDSVMFHLHKLREQGRVTWKDGLSRTLKVTP